MSLRNLISEQKAFYKSVVSVYCKILGETVYFTSEGFNHLLYENYWKPRKASEQFLKLKCLSYAPEVITKCSKKANIREVKRKIKGIWKKTFQYELVYEVMPKAKVRIIVEKIGTGHHSFRSVMPHDNKSKLILSKKQKSTC